MNQSYFSYFTCTSATTNDAAATTLRSSAILERFPTRLASLCRHRLAGHHATKVSFIKNTLKHALSMGWKQPW
jgi:hypothetical protein